jgi:hypothetical protein
MCIQYVCIKSFIVILHTYYVCNTVQTDPLFTPLTKGHWYESISLYRQISLIQYLSVQTDPLFTPLTKGLKHNISYSIIITQHTIEDKIKNRSSLEVAENYKPLHYNFILLHVHNTVPVLSSHDIYIHTYIQYT